jgi:hypothetical protein
MLGICGDLGPVIGLQTAHTTLQPNKGKLRGMYSKKQTNISGSLLVCMDQVLW